jgi:RimJ/RimL family protein N-acetyltransferase
MLEPLRVEHAEEMIAILQDPSLYTYTGGQPPNLEELRSRYERQTVGHSADGTQGWLNWTIRERDHRAVVGTVQATLRHELAVLSADLAWVIDVDYQRRGYATEAGRAMKQWLTACGVESIVAYIHPDHDASAAVARRLGLIATDNAREGEIKWTTHSASSATLPSEGTITEQPHAQR